jgi:hypothetical protein
MRTLTSWLACGAAALLVAGGGASATDPASQGRTEPGKSIGTITTQGDLIVLTLAEGALGRANLFDLAGRSLRFTPDGPAYRVENGPLRWDAEFGEAMAGAQATLRQFTFPFSGQNWNALSVGTTGSISFAPAGPLAGSAAAAGGAAPAGGGRGGGVTIGRFDQLQQAARALVNTAPAICVFLKPRMSGTRYFKELPDRAVVTWSLTEPVGGIQDFTWTPTVNRFQAVLWKDGRIDFAYEHVAARDAIVGLYPVAAGAGPNARPAAEVDLSALSSTDGPFPVVFESFHYLALPNARDLTCTVINALGDRFDLLAYYSDFRIDNQEAGTPSTGPLGGGPDGGAVTGIGANQRNLAAYCTQGRFQWQFVQPVFSGSNQMQARPPEGAASAGSRTVMAYLGQLGARSPDPDAVTYNYAMSQLAHEMGHRWSAFVRARVGPETIPLGPTHWARGLHAPAAFPYRRLVEASIMGGGVWQDNLDGTFTQLDDDYYVPATGWSHLDLYLMGLAAPSEVPDFFILRNLVAAGRDAGDRPIFRADRTKVTIQDVIAAEGPRLPDVDRSQKTFNTGIVVMVEPGRTPSREILAAANAIKGKWIEYWAATTGRRSAMAVTAR